VTVDTTVTVMPTRVQNDGDRDASGAESVDSSMKRRR
jgi:hypothetical protein